MTLPEPARSLCAHNASRRNCATVSMQYGSGLRCRRAMVTPTTAVNSTAAKTDRARQARRRAGRPSPAANQRQASVTAVAAAGSRKNCQ